METRTYPVRNAGTRETMQLDYSAKLQKNKEAGHLAFSTGEFKPFDGMFEENLITPFYIRLELDQKSQQEIMNKVAQPLEQIANKYNIPSIFTGKNDLPPHVSFDIGMINGMTPEQVEKAHKWFVSNKSHVQALTKILAGLTFHIDTLVVAPNSYLCASRFDDEQGAPYRARMAIEQIMDRAVKAAGRELGEPINGTIAPPYRYDDIFHVSVSRVTGKADASQLMQFAQEANETVGADVSQNPIPITVANVRIERPIEFYKEFAPQLIK